MAFGILSFSIAAFLKRDGASRWAPPEHPSCRSCRPSCPVACPVVGSLAGGLRLTLGLPPASACRHLGLPGPALGARWESEAPSSSTETGRGHGRRCSWCLPAAFDGDWFNFTDIVLERRLATVAPACSSRADRALPASAGSTHGHERGVPDVVHSGVDGNVRSQREHARRDPTVWLLGRSPSARWRGAILAPASSYPVRSLKSCAQQAPTTVTWWR